METKPHLWYENDPLARHLCCLTPEEIDLFRQSDLIDVRPVILPHEKYVVTENDYFDWPIATLVDDTIVVLYDRRYRHGKVFDEYSVQGMIVVSHDKGETWSEPFDLREAGTWEVESPFLHWAAGLGVHEGSVFALLTRGLYRSDDKGRAWRLVDARPKFCDIPGKARPGTRLTFDQEHGLISWGARWEHVNELGGGKIEYGYDKGYHEGIRAVYSPDFGHTWHSAEQDAPTGHYYNEITPYQHGQSVVFFNRSDHWFNEPKPYAQAFSRTGWFPFTFAFSNVIEERLMDTPDVNFNPVTGRFEAAVNHRFGAGPGPSEKQKLNLYSIGEEELFAGGTKWRYEGTLVQYRDKWGKAADGMNPVGSVILDGNQYIYVWGGDLTDKSGIFQYTRSLDTDKVREYLLQARGEG